MLKKVIEIAHGAGDIICDMRKHGFATMKKSDTGYVASDIVTEADYAADDYIREQLGKRFPGEQILTEETEKTCTIDWSQPCRIVDPLDGTNNFSTGKDIFGVLIGKVENGVPVLGVAHFPLAHLTFRAEAGGGAYCNGERIHISSDNNIIEGKVINEISHKNGQIYNTTTNKTLPGIASRGCIGRSLCDIASGGLGGLLRTYTLGGKRDTCGPQIILKEAGGILTDTHGNNLNYKQQAHHRQHGYCAGTPKQHANILDFLN